MPKVMKMTFPHDILWDETLMKFKYLGKDTDRIGHVCPIGKATAIWCLSICEFSRVTPHAGGMQMVCAYESMMEQGMRQELGADEVDIRAGVKEAVEWDLNEKRDVRETFTFKPTPDNPWGFTILGSDPWEFGLVEKPILDPRIKRPKL